MKSTIGLLFVGLVLTGPALARTETCETIDENGVAALFDRWNATLASGDPRKVVANYAERSVLLPTLSNTPRLTPQAKMEYFVEFLRKKPNGTIVSRTIEIDCNSAIDAGLYTFRFGDGSQAKARYSFSYHWDGKAWLITSHHSSLMPEKKS